MKQLFQENKNAFLMLLGLVFILILSVYFLFYRPVSADLQQTVTQEQNLHHEIDLLEAQVQKLETDSDQSAEDIENIQLEKKIPKVQELEKFLLTLNEIELVSDTEISNMSFGYQGNLPERSVTEDENIDEAVEESQKTEETTIENEATEEFDESEVTTMEFIEMPEGLQPVIVTLDIEAPDYEHFQLLLKEIEKQERIMIVTNVTFNNPGEYELKIVEEPDKSVAATINVTTFYYEN